MDSMETGKLVVLINIDKRSFHYRRQPTHVVYKMYKS